MIHDPEMTASASRQLGALINRAQDERIKLMQAVKSYEGKLDSIPEPVSSDHIQRLMQLVTRVGDAMNERMDTLSELDQHIDRRLDQMARVEATLLNLTGRLGQQLEEAKDFKALVDTSKRQVRAAAAAAKAELEQHQTGQQDRPAAPRLVDDTDRPLRALAARLNAQSG